MDVFIEKEFLTKFIEESATNKNTTAYSSLYNILTDYPEVTLYTNDQCESVEQFEHLRVANEVYFKRTAANGRIKADSFLESNVFENDFKQTIVLTLQQKDWFKPAEKKGALCMSFDSYLKKIDDLIKNHTKKIDLSEGSIDWSEFSSDFPLSQLLVNDSYMFCNKSNQYIDDNILPLIDSLLGSFKNKKVSVELFYQPDRDHRIKQNEKVFNKLKEKWSGKKCEFKLINNSFVSLAQYNFHDRMILTNFQLIESGKGFNLMPYRKNNSQVIFNTIFERYSYKRLKNIRKMHSDYLQKLMKHHPHKAYDTYLTLDSLDN